MANSTLQVSFQGTDLGWDEEVLGLVRSVAHSVTADDNGLTFVIEEESAEDVIETWTDLKAEVESVVLGVRYIIGPMRHG